MLKVAGVSAAYHKITVLRAISLEISQGEAVGLLGANGAGKTTLLKVLSGLLKPVEGRIEFLGQDITHLAPEKRVQLGLSQVPEGRQVFAGMSVEESLILGAYTRFRGASRAALNQDLDYAYYLFPVLKNRIRQRAETLSGGEQRMLAIGQALMSRPKLLLLDEPSLGLAPLIVDTILEVLRRLVTEGVTILLVEQDTASALVFAQRAYVLRTGEIVLSGVPSTLMATDELREIYLGGGMNPGQGAGPQ